MKRSHLGVIPLFHLFEALPNFFFFSLLFCRFDRIQLSLFPQSDSRSVWSRQLTTTRLRRLDQQEPDGPEVRRAERKYCVIPWFTWNVERWYESARASCLFLKCCLTVWKKLNVMWFKKTNKKTSQIKKKKSSSSYFVHTCRYWNVQELCQVCLYLLGQLILWTVIKLSKLYFTFEILVVITFMERKAQCLLSVAFSLPRVSTGHRTVPVPPV